MAFLTIDSNIGELAAAFDALLAHHRSKPTSALRIPTVHWIESLENTAITTASDGTSFRYFSAVDTGRKAIDLRGTKPKRFVVFGSTGRNLTITQVVKASKGLHITERSLAAILPVFDAELSAAFNLIRGGFNVQEFVRTANQAAAQARQPNSKAPRFRFTINDDLIIGLCRYGDWTPIAKTFEKVTEKLGVGTFKKNTPRRKTRQELHYIGGGQVEAVPVDPDHLKDSYVLLRDRNLELLLGAQPDTPTNAKGALVVRNRTKRNPLI